jgi:hypothetical protein
MGPQPVTATSSLRKVRTFADDVRRAQGGVPDADTTKLTTAKSVVAPTVNVRSVGPIPEALTKSQSTQSAVPTGIKAALSSDLMDIRNEAEGAQEATIVSERTRKKWSFTSAVKQSVGSWWKETLAEIQEETGTPKSLRSHVAPSEKRARIVRAARSDGKIAPSEDVPAFVKTIPPATTENPPMASPADAGTTGWTHVDDAPVITGDRVPSAEPIPKLAKTVIRPLTLDIPPSRTDRPVPPPEPTPELRNYSSAPVSTNRTNDERAWADPEQSLAPQEGIDESLRAREEAIRMESAKFAERAREAARRRKEYEASQQPSSGSKYFVFGTLGIIGLSIVVLVGVAGYAFFTRQGPLVEAPEPGIRLLFSVSESIGVPMIGDRADFIADASQRVAEATGPAGTFVRFYYYYQSDRSETELPAQAFLDVLDLRAPGSFLRTIEPTMMFGSYIDTVNAPFIVFKVRSFEDALGGMLLFEPNMNSDFAPLMGEMLSRSGQTGAFRDEIIAGVDARSLYDDFGNRVMMYAFIDRETLVITTSPAALGALAQVLK